MPYSLTGTTKNNLGVTLGSCDVFLFKYDSGTTTFTQMAYTTSDASTGAYTFSGIADNAVAYMVTAFKDGTPNVFDVTDHNLQPV